MSRLQQLRIRAITQKCVVAMLYVIHIGKIELIREAIERHKTVHFTYLSPKEETLRNIEPYYLVFHWSSWYVWGWCRTKKAYRLFKLNRMTGLSAAEHFEPRCAPLPHLEPEHVFPVKYKATVLFDSSCRWRLTEEYGADRFTVEVDGRLRFTGGFPDEDAVLSWILTFGDKAEVLEPPDLREKLWVLAETLSLRYKKEN